MITSSPLQGAVCMAVLLALTAVSWTALWLYERRQDRREDTT